MPPFHLSSITQRRSLCLVATLLLLLRCNSAQHEFDPDTVICDSFNVVLKATFPDKVAIPCSETQTKTIEALIHSLVETDVIVGLHGMPVRDFFLGFQSWGDGVTQSSFYDDEMDFPMTQLQNAYPHLKPEDLIEDIYYSDGISNNGADTIASYYQDQNNNTNKEFGVDQQSSGDMSDVAENTQPHNDEESLKDAPLIGPYEEEPRADFDVIEPYEDSFRTGGSDRRLFSNVNDLLSRAEDNTTTTEATDSDQGVGSGSSGGGGGGGCSTTWCGYYFSKPCLAIPHDPKEDSLDYKERIRVFEERVANSIERKLRKWARDTDCMCLGNSWELQATVRKLL